jgi:hypothetical protein
MNWLIQKNTLFLERFHHSKSLLIRILLYSLSFFLCYELIEYVQITNKIKHENNKTKAIIQYNIIKRINSYNIIKTINSLLCFHSKVN